MSEQVDILADPQYEEELRGPQSNAAHEVEPLAVDAAALTLNIIGTTQAELSGGAVLIDGAGAQFEADVTALQLITVTKRLPDGSVAGTWPVQRAGVVLSGPVSLDAAGNDVIVYVTGHQNVPGKPRDNYKLAQRIVGVYAPYAQHPGQGEGAFTSGEPATPVGDGLTLLQLTTATGHDHDYRAALGGLMLDTVAAGMVAAFAAGGAFYHGAGAYSRVSETDYESTMNALRDYNTGASGKATTRTVEQGEDLPAQYKALRTAMAAILTTDDASGT
jgi:hypothetical protein